VAVVVETRRRAGFVLYGVGEHRGAVVELAQFVVDRALGARGLKQHLCDFPAAVFVGADFLNSVDRAHGTVSIFVCKALKARFAADRNQTL